MGDFDFSGTPRERVVRLPSYDAVVRETVRWMQENQGWKHDELRTSENELGLGGFF